MAQVRKRQYPLRANRQGLVRVKLQVAVAAQAQGTHFDRVDTGAVRADSGAALLDLGKSLLDQGDIRGGPADIDDQGVVDASQKVAADG